MSEREEKIEKHILPEPSLHKLLQRLVLALDRGHINGVIWAVSKKARKTPNLDHPISRANGKVYKLGHVLDGSMPDLLAPEFAPQRTILDHSHTRLYLTHGVLGFLLDELANGMRLEEAGCGLRLDKNSFMAGEIVERACRLVSGDDEAVARTVERLRRIATESTRRKGLAANLIEEAL
ncbi:hypothetical protein S40285_09034 [Stachybotrys chlorohalonatus IBT 40285]|uniref:Uncharacterized protein n=1 Tax=Stachybotrys chlorohalonatus (strain IBT 40285) TaxID=1283841 RepID=A0A084QV62_STAC4|nr:hypothetical protein S40285_09034 [Stachybotrys chlorohalonata IBT 40285]